MLSLISALVVAAAILWVGQRVTTLRASPVRELPHLPVLLGLFAPGMAAVAEDPRALLIWQPLASTARALFPTEFAELDRAHGRRFPFDAGEIQAAHARWTVDWLEWERAHDADYKAKIAEAAHGLGDAVRQPHGRARLESIEREKLERYQRRYEEYTRVSRALQALSGETGRPPSGQ